MTRILNFVHNLMRKMWKLYEASFKSKTQTSRTARFKKKIQQWINFRNKLAKSVTQTGC